VPRPGPRAALIRRLQDRHDEQVRAALAELVTFVLLDSVYPAIEVDPGTGSGSRTDFAVDVPVRTHFEVHRPAPPPESAMDARRLGDIAAELEKIESPDFWLDVDPQSGTQVPSMRQVRRQAEVWLASLDYETEVRRRDEYQQARRERAAEPMPGLDASPAERAAYFAARRPFEPAAFTRSGDGWSVRITAHPRPADQRGPGQFTVGLRSAGAAHLETFEGLQAAVRGKLRQHAGLADPLVVVLDLSSPIIEHASPKRGVSQTGDGVVTIDLHGPVLDPEADADRVYHLLIEAMEAIRQAMVTIRNDLAKAVRAAGLWYHEPTPRLTAARQEGELTKLATKVGTWADLRSPAGAGNPMYLACTWGRGSEPSDCAIRQISRCVMPSAGPLERTLRPGRHTRPGGTGGCEAD